MPSEQCKLICPKCKKYWAVLKFDFGSYAKPSDVTIVSGTRKKFKKQDSLLCSLCGYEYTNHDVILSINDPAKEVEPGGEAKV